MTENVEQHMKEIASFLQINYTDTDMYCLMQNHRGNFLRKQKGVTIESVFDENKKNLVKEATARVLSMLHKKFPKFANLTFKSI